MVSDDTGAVPDSLDPKTGDRAHVRRELAKLKELARAMSLDELRDGVWFAKLVRYSLDSYVHEVDADYFASLYPGLSTDQVMAARIQSASRYASLEGGISAGAYTGALAATIGSGGGASPLTLPAAGASFVLDLLYVSHLQLRLAHDIAVLSRVPLDLTDPEDLWKLIRIAFAVKSEEAGRQAIGVSVPALVRPIVQKLFRGATLTAAKNLPLVGRYLLQRNLVKFAIPAVGVPLSMAVNYWSTTAAANSAVMAFRAEGKIVAAARQMTNATEHHAALLWVLWLIVKSDALVHEKERLLLKHVTAVVGDLDTELSAIASLAPGLAPDSTAGWAMLDSAAGDLEALYDAAVVAAAVDGTINVNELSNLKKLAKRCSVTFDEQAARRAAADFASQTR